MGGGETIPYLLISSSHGAVGDGIEGEQQIAVVFILPLPCLQLRLQLRCEACEIVKNLNNPLLNL